MDAINRLSTNELAGASHQQTAANRRSEVNATTTENRINAANHRIEASQTRANEAISTDQANVIQGSTGSSVSCICFVESHPNQINAVPDQERQNDLQDLRGADGTSTETLTQEQLNTLETFKHKVNAQPGQQTRLQATLNQAPVNKR